MIEGFTLAKLAKAIGIRGFVAIGLGLALIFVMIRAHHISSDLEVKRNELAGERAAHAITRGSVDTLQAALEKFVGEGEAARVAQLASIEAQAKDNADLQAQADAIRAEMEAMGDRAADPNCRSPGSVINARGL